MCFISSGSASAPIKEEDPVERHQADASITKTKRDNINTKNYLENTKTAPLGLEDSANTKKKTLLGE